MNNEYFFHAGRITFFTNAHGSNFSSPEKELRDSFFRSLVLWNSKIKMKIFSSTKPTPKCVLVKLSSTKPDLDSSTRKSLILVFCCQTQSKNDRTYLLSLTRVSLKDVWQRGDITSSILAFNIRDSV
jgi:hypothetical protein